MLLRITLLGMLSALVPQAALAVSPAQAVLDVEGGAAKREWRSIVLHHSATSGGSVASIDAVHRRQRDAAGNPWLGIGYHFVVGNGHSMADGEVQPTFRWREQLAGAHAGRSDQNDHGIGICLIGNFNDAPPTARQLAALGTLLRTLGDRYSISRTSVLRHQDVHPTKCPGRLFPWEQVLADVPEMDGS